MSSPKRHHYLPDFYLQSFCGNGFIWVYDRELREYRKQTPINTAVKSNYYAFRDENGVRNNEIEAILARVEGATKPVLSKLAAGKSPTPDDRYTLSLFVSFLKVRVPNFQHQVNEQTSRRVKRDARMSFGASEAQAEAFLKRFQAATGTDPELSAKELFDFVRRDNYDVKVHRNFSLSMMMGIVLDFAAYFHQIDWAFMRAPKKTSFVTSDSPVVLIRPAHHDTPLEGIDVFTPGTRKLVTLTQQIALIMFDEGERVGWKDASQETVRGINLAVAAKSHRFVICRDEALLKSLVRKSRIDQLDPSVH